MGNGFQASLPMYKDDASMPQNSARGIMVRTSDSPTSPLLFIGVWSGSILACLRDPKGILHTTNAVIQQWPVILKFERGDNQIAAAYSFDHKNWTSFEGYEFPRQINSPVGFVAWSGDDSNHVTARFVLLPSDEGNKK